MFGDFFDPAFLLSFILLMGFLLSGILLTFKIPNRAILLSISVIGHLPFFAFSLIQHSSASMPIQLSIGSPRSHFGLSFFFDGLSSLFFFLISFVGILVSIFSSRYFKSLDDLRKILGLLSLFAVSMYGITCSDNLLLLFIFWELTTLVSFFLISFQKEDPKTRQSALQALMLTGLGGLALLFSILALAQTLPHPSVREILLNPHVILDSPHKWLILTGFLIAILTKSAIFPFHYWLPGAMTAPTPVSAYLHSATMVKAGLFLYARLSPAFQAAPFVPEFFALTGGITSIWGIVQSLRVTDLKLILAYTTLSALGLIMMLMGSSYDELMIAGLLVLTTHAIYKSGLFIFLGSFEKLAGHRDLTKRADLFTKSPLSGIGFLLLIFSMIGLPPFLGFIAKESAYLAALDRGQLGSFIAFCLFFVGALHLGLGLKLLKALLPWPISRSNEPNKAPSPAHLHFFSWVGPLVLGLCSLIFGIYPQALENLYLQSATQSFLQKNFQLSLSLWHGFNLALGLSAGSFLLGFFVYHQRTRLQSLLESLSQRLPSFAEAHERFFLSLLRLGQFQATYLIPKHVKSACAVVLLVTSSCLAFLFFVYSKDFLKFFSTVPFYMSWWEVPPVLLVLAASFLVFKAKNTFSALLATGLSGFSVVLVFSFYSAPDLALTQILVETLLLVLLASILSRINLNKFRLSISNRISLSLLPAVAAGLISLAHASIQSPSLADRVSSRFAQDSYQKAHGRNVVNVILVDFRGMDTLGELTVLGIAALGALALFGKRAKTVKKDSR